MACATCQSGSGTPGGCQDNGHCATGGCNKMNTYDWLAKYEFEDPTGTDIVEVSFKKGARKEFYRNHKNNPALTREMVVVDTGTGFDVGIISLTGELVRMQMKKKRVKELTVTNPVVRVANDRDIDRLNEVRSIENQAMVRGRAIVVSMGLDMKICDVEYRGDGRKATFYYTAEGRVDFRELVRTYAKEFQVKIEMRQIGARQESARIGGIGTCGRELCCSTWLTDFKSVNTHSARYQNLSINQTKLSGQCGRLKCCLNYELDTYLDALKEFPKDVDLLKYRGGNTLLIKTDIFKRLLYYSVQVEKGRNTIIALSLDRVKEIKAMNLKGELPDQLQDPNLVVEEAELDFADVTGVIELPDVKKKKGRNKRKSGNRSNNPKGSGQGQQRRDRPKNEGQKAKGGQKQGGDQKTGTDQQPKGERNQNQGQEGDKSSSGEQPRKQGNRQNRNRNKNRNKGPRPNGGDKPTPNNPQS